MHSLKKSMIIPLLLLFIGFSCVGYYFYEVISTKQSVKANIEAVSAKEISENLKNGVDPAHKLPDVTFDSSQVDQMTPEKIRQVREKMKNPYYRQAVKENALGALSIPDARMQITVLKGLSETNLVSGAGTFWEDQKMGQNNYPLASHNVNNENLLLGPLFRTKPGMKAYLTDFKKIYVYRIKSVALYSPSRGDLIDLYKDKPTLTLVTCGSFNDISERCIGIGHLVDTLDYDSAPEEIKNSFGW